MVVGDITEDFSKRADLDISVHWHGNVELAIELGRERRMASFLADQLISKLS
jgi:hypothetical protein